jgi:hypothetical protein
MFHWAIPGWWKIWEWPGRAMKWRQQWHEMKEAAARRRVAETQSTVQTTPLLAPEQTGPVAHIAFMKDARGAFVEVTNAGLGAHFHAPIEIHGAIRGKGKDVFAKWAHTGEVRAWIAKGQTCRLEIARLKWNAGGFYTSTWIIPTVASGNVVEEVESLYSSCPVSEPIIRADDIIVSGLVIAEPDLENGIQPFRVILRAFEAVNGEVAA